MIETTVVGWDGGSSARAALRWAADDFPVRSLHLIRVVGAGVSEVEMFAPNAPAADLRVALMDEAASVREAHPGLHVTSELVFGDPVEELRALSNPTSLLVVGAGRQQSGASRWSLGARMAGSATGSVAVIPAGGTSGMTGVAVGVDGTESSTHALLVAASEAHRTGQQLHAIRAWQEPPVWADAQIPDPDYLRSLEEMYGHILDDALAEIRRTYPDLGIRRSLLRGAATEVLPDAARGAALIVVGSHGHTGLKRFFLGSVSHSLLLTSTAPILIVPPTQ